jgi:hypothetical protein
MVALWQRERLGWPWMEGEEVSAPKRFLLGDTSNSFQSRPLYPDPYNMPLTTIPSPSYSLFHYPPTPLLYY